MHGVTRVKKGAAALKDGPGKCVQLKGWE